jgi:SAM-dependent methyltransferase
MSKKTEEEVRAAYELRPYPSVTREAMRHPAWRLPPWEWITSLVPVSVPRRILVAGCGTGLEAFALRRRFPKAEIVGIDFAPHSIAIARRLQKRSVRWRSLRFACADLTNARLAKEIGDGFDFISCHGVLSYLPAPERALRNLTRCLAPEGLFYLGVNGAAHFSRAWRKFLPAFGFAMERWLGGARLWRHLELSAAIADGGHGELLRHGAGYFASDLFAPLIHNLPLAEWAGRCRRAGLHLRGSCGTQRLLWPTINDESYELFMPRSRGEIAALVDRLRPNSFHRLIFTRRAEPAPPWLQPNELMKWRPRAAVHARRRKWPKTRRPRLFKIQSRADNRSIELRGAQWEIDLLRGSDGAHSIREILKASARAVAPAAVRSQLYRFYLLEFLNLLPPAKEALLPN